MTLVLTSKYVIHAGIKSIQPAGKYIYVENFLDIEAVYLFFSKKTGECIYVIKLIINAEKSVRHHGRISEVAPSLNWIYAECKLLLPVLKKLQLPNYVPTPQLN